MALNFFFHSSSSDVTVGTGSLLFDCVRRWLCDHKVFIRTSSVKNYCNKSNVEKTHTKSFFLFLLVVLYFPPQAAWRVSTGSVCIAVPLPLSLSLHCIRTLSSKRVQTEKRKGVHDDVPKTLPTALYFPGSNNSIGFLR